MPPTNSSDRLVCTNPFEWFEVHPDGRVFLCCPAWLKTPIGNLLEDSVEDVWNSPTAQRIRQSILDGSFQHCNKKRCPRLHSETNPVMQRADVPNEEVKEALGKKETVLPYGPKRLNLCYDQSCNLACPTCRTDFFTENGEDKDRVSLITRKIHDGAGRWAETLILSGLGDPFGSSHFRKMMQTFRPENWPRVKNVHLHTNGQLWDEKMWMTMKGIHPFVKSAEISVDAAAAETYAANRGGVGFARLLDNFEYLKTLPVEVKISFVAQRNNYREMPAFAALGRKYGFRVYFSQLVNWGTFTREEFRRRAVHLPGHPEHEQFVNILKQVDQMENVDIGNLHPLICGARFIKKDQGA